MNFKLFSFVFFIINTYSIFAINITVNVVNGSLQNKPQILQNIDLLQLKDTMSVIRSLKPTSSSVIFSNIKEADEGFPLMVKTEYNGVTYNQMIPPVERGDKNITLTIYEKTNQFKDISYRSVYAVKYYDNALHFVIISIFDNKSAYTFTEKDNGIYQVLPPNAQNIEASVSVGSGKSNINWLRLTVQKTNRENVWLLPYSIKSGEKIYQTSFSLPYDGKSLNLPIISLYPLSSSLQFIFESPGLIINIPDQPTWKPTLTKDDSIEGDIVELPKFSNKLSIQITGGEQVEHDHAEHQEAEATSQTVEILSSISRVEKFVYILILLSLFIGIIFYLYKRPTWLKNYWIEKSLKIRYKLDTINKMNLSDDERNILKNKYLKQLEKIENNLTNNN